MRDPHGQFLRALRIAAGDPSPFPAETHSTAWASATFVGARHCVTLRFTGRDATARADALALGIEEREFILHGHLLADIAVVGQINGPDEASLTIEALTIEDAS